MLRPIPAKILRHTVTFGVPSAVDTFQNPIWDESSSVVVVDRVAVQPTDRTKKTKDNTEVELSSIVFIDARNSTPVDVQTLKDDAEAAGHSLLMEFAGRIYTVMYIDKLFDDTSTFHHWEVGVL